MRELIMNIFFQGLLPKHFKMSLQTSELTFIYVFSLRKKPKGQRALGRFDFQESEPRLNNEKEGLNNLYNLSKVR